MPNVVQAAGDFGRVEYRIIEKPRYIVTRFEEGPDGKSGSVSERGTYDNPDIAWEVAYALCRRDHEMFGYPPDDERIQYPKHPRGNWLSKIGAAAPSIRRPTTTPE